MLQVSEKAAMALEAIRRSEEVPESHGTRLSPATQPGGDLAIRLEFVEEVSDDDRVAEQGDTEVHVAPALVDPLADAIMDVEDTEDGLTFVFRGA